MEGELDGYETLVKLRALYNAKYESKPTINDVK